MTKRVGANRRLKMKSRKRKAPKKVRGIISRSAGFIRVVLIALCIAALGFFGARRASGFITTIDILKVRTIEVHGVEQVDTAEVLSLAAIQPGISMLDMKMGDIRKQIRKNPWIAKVNVRRKIPHTIVITVTERKPVAFINLGSIHMSDQDGFLWPLNSHTYWNLPIISGLADTIIDNTCHKLKKDQAEKMSTFFKDIRSSDEQVPLRISQIDFSKNDVVSVKLESSPVHAVIKSSTVVKDMHNLREILRIMEEKAEKMPRYINLYYNSVAFVK